MKATLRTLAVAALFPVLSFAASANSAKVTFNGPTEVAGTALPSGDYTLNWEGTGPDVKVNFLKGKKIVATAPAQLPNGNNEPSGTIETKKVDNGHIALQTVSLKKQSLVFPANASTASTSEPTTGAAGRNQ